MTIHLKPEQENFIREQVASGRYNSPEEVIAKMFLIFQKVQGDYEQWLEETKTKIDEGIVSLDQGEGVDGEIVINELRKKLRQTKEN
jgi:antitoxin ParD1/3/4